MTRWLSQIATRSVPTGVLIDTGVAPNVVSAIVVNQINRRSAKALLGAASKEQAVTERLQSSGPLAGLKCGDSPRMQLLRVSYCWFCGHEGRIVTKERERKYDETEVQPCVQD